MKLIEWQPVLEAHTSSHSTRLPTCNRRTTATTSFTLDSLPVQFLES